MHRYYQNTQLSRENVNYMKYEYFARVFGALSLCVYNLNFDRVMEMCVSKPNSRRM